MKILIVEDEPSLREVMQRALRQEGYVVETAATYAEADRRVSGYDYDCILLDIMLPDGNGLRLLERIKELRRKENVIIVSARDSLEDQGTRSGPWRGRLSCQALSIRPSCWPASKACCAAAAAEEI